MKFRYVYFAISIVFIAVGIFSIFKWGFKIGVDFTGGGGDFGA
jgi:preprotein translocase subunit SecF